jgi:penicillin-binding protein 1A
MLSSKIFKYYILLLLFIFFNSLDAQDLPPFQLKFSSYAVTEDGKVLGYFGEQNRVEILDKNQISQYVIDCLLAAEDKEFYSHNGVSIKGLIRATWKTITGSKQGGSTLTMQLARNLFLSNEQTLSRKIKEIDLALDIEKKYTKDQILLLYLNTVYFGHGAYGIWVASQEYFSKTPDKLNIIESATLIGLLKSPAGYDPINYPDKTLKRRNIVLHSLVEDEKITEGEYLRLKSQPLNLNVRENNAGHFLEHIRKEVSESLKRYGKTLDNSELKITTSLDILVQKSAETAVNNEWKLFPKSMQDAQIGLVVIENKTGKVRALVGGNQKSNPHGLNHALDIHRQPGSSFKAFLYASLIEKGYTLATPLLDSLIVVDSGKINEWRPMNDDDSFSGKRVPMKFAIQHSLNLATAHAITELTKADSLIIFVKRLGIISPLPPYPSLALGTGEVTPIEMAGAISVYPSEGILAKPKTILKIEDKYNNILYNYSMDTNRVLDPETSYLITNALQAVVDSGTATSIRRYYKGPAAGKTGTTQNSTDAWFIGYTPIYSTAIWIGFDNPKNKLSGDFKYGGKVCAPIWGMMMNEIAKQMTGIENVEFRKPTTIIDLELCTDTGLLATEKCPHRKVYPVNSLKIPPFCQIHKQ